MVDMPLFQTTFGPPHSPCSLCRNFLLSCSATFLFPIPFPSIELSIFFPLLPLTKSHEFWIPFRALLKRGMMSQPSPFSFFFDFSLDLRHCCPNRPSTNRRFPRTPPSPSCIFFYISEVQATMFLQTARLPILP